MPLSPAAGSHPQRSPAASGCSRVAQGPPAQFFTWSHAQLLSSEGTKPICQLQEEREPFCKEERPTSSLHLLHTHDLWFHVAQRPPTSPLQQRAETPEAIHGVSGDIPSLCAHPHGCCAAPSHPAVTASLVAKCGVSKQCCTKHRAR